MSAGTETNGSPGPKLEEPLSKAHTIFSERRKICYILTCTSISFLGPMAGTMYFPALGPLAEALGVSDSDIIFTITTYKLVQALAPLLTAPVSDKEGRRPVFLGSLVVFLVSNIGLALQTNFVALLLLRLLQSFGSGSVTIVSGAAITDLVARGERGKYMIYSSLGSNFGLAIGPVIGGILTQFWGWRSLFWFLVIITGPPLVIMVSSFPETCRSIVGDGSISPQWWNRNMSELLLGPKHSKTVNYETQATFKRRPSILNTLKLLWDRHMAILTTSSALFASGVTVVLATLPTTMEAKYGFNPLQVGLCYIPYAAGSLTARWTAGSLVDWNFKRHASRVGILVEPNRAESRQQLQLIPVEKARLELLLPFLYFSSLVIVAYGWTMNYHIHLSGPLVLLFFLGNGTAGVNSILSTLVVDLHANQAGSALAAVNAVKNLSAAAAAAAAVPMVDCLGFGWSGVVLAGLWTLISPGLWLVYFRGHIWRQTSNTEL